MKEIINAFRSPSFPCNPRPFARALDSLIAEKGSDAIKSDEGKAILWVLISQAYGQGARLDLFDEWTRLDNAISRE
jgi:hypothetical protein